MSLSAPLATLLASLPVPLGAGVTFAWRARTAKQTAKEKLAAAIAERVDQSYRDQIARQYADQRDQIARQDADHRDELARLQSQQREYVEWLQGQIRYYQEMSAPRASQRPDHPPPPL